MIKMLVIFMLMILFVTLILVWAYRYINNSNKTSELLSNINTHPDLIAKCQCHVNFSSDSDGHFQYHGKMNLYLFEYALLLTSIQKPRVIKDELLIYLYSDFNKRKTIRPVDYFGRISWVRLEGNTLKFDTILSMTQLLSFIFQHTDCEIELVNNDEFMKALVKQKIIKLRSV